MPMLLIAEVPNLPEKVYASMADQMGPLMRASKGFIFHAGGPNLPPGIVPKQTYYPLHTTIAK
jgi:hypothetical protein